MVKILVWVLVLHSQHGGVVIYDNLASQDSCERLLSRAKAGLVTGYSHQLGDSCTQVEKLVPAQLAPVVDVSPAEIKVPPPQVRVIIKEKQ